MMRIFLPFCLILTLSACSSGNTQITAGTHNLSKGDCRNIRVCANGEQCKTYQELIPKAQCDMLGGEFTPRDYHRGWLF